ncbi:hypothetical protein [Alcaligenes endophyticus]|uniref:Autotransporter domain-containing protein n=1 Tax=Alcaligenes endophyticus TaxID=1929088 RepID=A0ABT8EFR1_9BURK|nr:hypothetical protein [Alcaligenes endophyticus]MCX5590215.1 hypothetical protein [Alcaligenes endophyticus]MDN4120121.1 hypothetical protein [Alcaligenes endophyticus]
MKTCLGLVVTLFAVKAAYAVPTPVHTIEREQDFGSGSVYEVHSLPLQVKGLVDTDKAFFIWWDAHIQVDQGARLGLSGEMRNPKARTSTIYKTGAGALEMAGESYLTGNVVVKEGSLAVKSSSAFRDMQQGIRLMPGTRLEYSPGVSVGGQIYLTKQADQALTWHVNEGWAEQLGDIHGDGVLHKTGAGQLRWPEQLRNNFNGLVVVQEGSLLFANLMPGSIHVQAELHAQSGAVQNLRLLPGARMYFTGPSPALMTVRRGFTLAPDSELVLRVWPDGSHDALDTYSSQLAGTLQVRAQPGEWQHEQAYIIVRAQDIVEGELSQLVLNRDELEASLDYEPQAVRLRISPRVGLEAAPTPVQRGLRHPYNAIYSSVAQDVTELARIQRSQVANNTEQKWWAWAQHRGQHHLRVGNGDQLSRHAEWLALGYTQPMRSGAKLSVAMASIQQRWQGAGKGASQRSNAHSAQLGLLYSQPFQKVWQAQAGLALGWHHLRDQGTLGAASQTLSSRHAHAQLAYTLWQTSEQQWDVWGRWDSVHIKPPTLSLANADRLQVQQRWQHQPGLGLSWNWHKKSWAMPASIMFNLGWHASPASVRSTIVDAAHRPVVDQSPYKLGASWAWSANVQSPLGKRGTLALHYMGSHSRNGGPDHGIGLQYQASF